MPPTALDLEPSSTADTVTAHDRWLSTTGKPEASGYARLADFDRVLYAELDRLAALKANWDAEGARPIGPAIVSAAREFISRLPRSVKNHAPLPALVPMPRGAERSANLQFEWDDGTRSLELEIETPATVHYLKWEPEEGCEEEDFFGIRDVGRAVSLIRWFARS